MKLYFNLYPLTSLNIRIIYILNPHQGFSILGCRLLGVFCEWLLAALQPFTPDIWLNTISEPQNIEQEISNWVHCVFCVYCVAFSKEFAAFNMSLFLQPNEPKKCNKPNEPYLSSPTLVPPSKPPTPNIGWEGLQLIAYRYPPSPAGTSWPYCGDCHPNPRKVDQPMPPEHLFLSPPVQRFLPILVVAKIEL